MKKIVITGAFDCGKTTVVHELSKRGFQTFVEAPRLVMKDLGERILGHELDKALKKIKDDDHICPFCKPELFTELCLKMQYDIERQAIHGVTIYERGFVDLLEFYNRITKKQWRNYSISRYDQVFLLDVLSEYQEAKWGKSIEERIMEAENINCRLEEMYKKFNCCVIKVPSGSIESRVEFIITAILSTW